MLQISSLVSLKDVAIASPLASLGTAIQSKRVAMHIQLQAKDVAMPCSHGWDAINDYNMTCICHTFCIQ